MGLAYWLPASGGPLFVLGGPMSDEDWAKSIIIHLTGRAIDPTPMLLQMIASIRGEGYLDALQPRADHTEESPNAV